MRIISSRGENYETIEEIIFIFTFLYLLIFNNI